MKTKLGQAWLAPLGALASLAPRAFPQTPIHHLEEDGLGGGGIGRDVAGIGDIDGDGFPDLAVRAFPDLRVYSGFDGALIHLIPFGSFQGLVAGPGDVNGDGIPDIYASDKSWNGGFGRLVVFSGVDASMLLDIQGTQHFTEELGGKAISWAGDLNADGHADLLASANRIFETSGLARAYSGADGSLLHEWEMVGIGFGWGLTGLGDVNGDGHDDVAIGALADFSNWPVAGKVFVYSGADYSLLYEIAGPVTFGPTGDAFGGTLDVIDDLDGDGVKELLAGLSGDDDAGQDSGSIFVHSGADGSLLLSIAGTHPGGGLGSKLDSAGDVNGDGLADIVSGSAASDFNGTDSGTVWLYSGRDGSLLYALHGQGTDNFAESVAGLGDVNGDGFSDIAIGAPNGGAGTDGFVDVLSGTCMPPAPYCTAAANSTGGPALMGHAGTLRFADNDFSLTVSGAVPQQFGVFFYGPDATEAPFGDGTLCVGGGAAGIFRLNPPAAIDGSGSAARALDFTQPPLSSGAGAVTPLSTWRFQFWYRDPQACGSSFNLSDGLEAYFCPGG